MQFIDFQSQLAHMRSAIDLRIKTVLDHGKFIMGPEVFELEQRLANYVDVKHCISCANGTDALQIALMANNIGPDDIVFTTAFSFFATAEVIPLVGATPYFVDIDLASYNLCPDSLRSAILKATKDKSGKPRAVIAVDMFGLPADYAEIQAICDEFGLILIEDAAQGFGGTLNGKKAGSFGDIATTSFFPAKPLGCCGDGGAIFTDDDDLAELARSIRVHGKGQSKYDNVRIGLNSRLDTIQAAILLEKFNVFENELNLRNEVASGYAEALHERFICPVMASNTSSAWAQYTIRSKTKHRQYWMDKLAQQDVPTVVYYPKAINESKAFEGAFSVPTPNTQIACNEVFSLPMHPYLSDDDRLKICDWMKSDE